MTSQNTNHCTFTAIVEISDSPSVVYGSTISFPASLQGPAITSIPDLHIVEFIPIEVEFYNDRDLLFEPTSVVFCSGTVSFKEHTDGSMPTINVRAYHLNICPGDPFTTAYIDTIPAMMNANLDIVGVVNRAVERRGDHRLFSIHASTYAGKDSTGSKYDHFDVCCILIPSDRWKRVDPRLRRQVHVQGTYCYTPTPLNLSRPLDCYLGDLVGFYTFDNKLSPCLLLQTLSYNTASANESPKPPASTVTTPRKRRLGEATLRAAPLKVKALTPPTIDADLPLNDVFDQGASPLPTRSKTRATRAPKGPSKAIQEV